MFNVTLSPGEWLPVLADRFDTRLPRLAHCRSYVNGNAPLPEMGSNTRATWEAFQKKARTNFGGIACASHANRIVARGVRVGDDQDAPIARAARRIWRNNRMPTQIADAVWGRLSTGVGYLVAGRGPSGRAEITAEQPEAMYADPDPRYPWRSRAALKVWRDSVAGHDFAQVWAPGERVTFARAIYAQNAALRAGGGGWEPVSREVYTGDPSVWIIDGRDGLGLVEPHHDLLDRINLDKLQRLSTAAMQAFKQRALTKRDSGVELPERDAAGNLIDYEKVFEAAPGALWDLPAGIDIWESTAGDLSQLLASERADARDFAAVSGTPVSMLLPEGANQSATGAQATTAQQVDACRADIERIRLAAASCMVAALRIEGWELADEDTVAVDFLDPAWITLAEQMDALSKAVGAGVSIESAQRTYLGWSQEQVNEDARYRARAAEVAAGE